MLQGVFAVLFRVCCLAFRGSTVLYYSEQSLGDRVVGLGVGTGVGAALGTGVGRGEGTGVGTGPGERTAASSPHMRGVLPSEVLDRS